ncbi:amidase family protein [Actinomadura sp. 6N118]|uniref:amidase family protein n=1 Tax=Actinomadura sp. 6N118 TaxID=3375151 RepID=UPI0037933EF9
MNETLFRSATDVAGMIRRREISSRELTETLFARVEAVNPVLNAVVECRREETLREAALADEVTARRGQAGPLHGVPITIKDSFDVAGMHTTWGDPGAKDFVADSDATIVRRLKEAGAIIAGKTNVAFMLADFAQTANELYGVTNNPWDPSRTPGGSTGAGAAALSAGMTFLEYGSDLVGSIRIPASFCGVYGLKPSAGIVPLTGFGPPGVPSTLTESAYMSSLGPLGRYAADLRTALQVTAGPEAPTAYTWALPPSRRTRLADFRVGYVLDCPQAPVSSEVGALLSDAMDALAKNGATLVEGWPGGVDPVREAESFGFHVGLFFAYQQPGEEFAPLSQVIEQEHRRMTARATWIDYFTGIDVFLCPSNFTPAFPHDARPFDQRTIVTPEGERPYTDQPFWISHASLAGLPAVVAPIGRTPAGLPVGLQIVGPLYEDNTAITFAEVLADVVGGYERPPL